MGPGGARYLLRVHRGPTHRLGGLGGAFSLVSVWPVWHGHPFQPLPGRKAEDGAAELGRSNEGEGAVACLAPHHSSPCRVHWWARVPMRVRVHIGALARGWLWWRGGGGYSGELGLEVVEVAGTLGISVGSGGGGGGLVVLGALADVVVAEASHVEDRLVEVAERLWAGWWWRGW